eukprot:1787594-Rhodomonas_salina.3
MFAYSHRIGAVSHTRLTPACCYKRCLKTSFVSQPVTQTLAEIPSSARVASYSLLLFVSLVSGEPLHSTILKRLLYSTTNARRMPLAAQGF